MTPLELIIHLILWPFNAAVYTYNVLALATGAEPPINFMVAAGAVALLLSLTLILRRGAG